MPTIDTVPGKKMIAFTLGTALVNKVARIVRFDAAGTVTVTDDSGNTSATLTVFAGETWQPVNVTKVTAVSYTGVVTGWE